MTLPLEDIPSNPFLRRVRAQSSLILDQVCAYARDGVKPHPVLETAWTGRIATIVRTAEDLLREVYGVKISDDDLTDLITEVTLGLSLDELVVEIRRIERESRE